MTDERLCSKSRERFHMLRFARQCKLGAFSKLVTQPSLDDVQAEIESLRSTMRRGAQEWIKTVAFVRKHHTLPGSLLGWYYDRKTGWHESAGVGYWTTDVRDGHKDYAPQMRLVVEVAPTAWPNFMRLYKATYTLDQRVYKLGIEAKEMGVLPRRNPTAARWCSKCDEVKPAECFRGPDDKDCKRHGYLGKDETLVCTGPCGVRKSLHLFDKKTIGFYLELQLPPVCLECDPTPFKPHRGKSFTCGTCNHEIPFDNFSLEMQRRIHAGVRHCFHSDVRCKGCDECKEPGCSNPCEPPQYGGTLTSRCAICRAGATEVCKTCDLRKNREDEYDTYESGQRKASCRQCHLNRTKQECKSCKELKTKDTGFTRYAGSNKNFHFDCKECEQPKCSTCSNRAQEVIRSCHREKWQCNDCCATPICSTCTNRAEHPVREKERKQWQCGSCRECCEICGAIPPRKLMGTQLASNDKWYRRPRTACNVMTPTNLDARPWRRRTRCRRARRGEGTWTDGAWTGGRWTDETWTSATWTDATPTGGGWADWTRTERGVDGRYVNGWRVTHWTNGRKRTRSGRTRRGRTERGRTTDGALTDGKVNHLF